MTTGRNPSERKLVKTHVKELIDELYAGIAEVARLMFGDESPQRLGPPATSEALAALERRFGGPLPPSYRAFLELHNGWEHFSGDARLLSVEDQSRPWVQARLAEFSGLLQEFGTSDPISDGCIPVYLGETEQDFALIDPRTRGADGEMAVLQYDLTEEVHRHSTFAEYLRGVLEVVTSIRDEELKGKKAPHEP